MGRDINGSDLHPVGHWYEAVKSGQRAGA